MRVGGYLTVLFIAGAIVLRLILKETGILMFWNYLIFGVPILIAYFVLGFVYFTTSRKVFWITVLAIVLAVFGFYLFDTMDNPQQLPI